MFHVRFERMFQIGTAQEDGNRAGDDLQQAPGKQHPVPERNINCCTSTATARVYDPSKPPWMQQPWQQPAQWAQQTSADSAATVASLPGPAGRLFGRKKKSMTTIWVDSRKRVAGTDSDFEFDVGETVHLQGSARLGVFKIRVADTFLSTDRGTFLYWKHTALGTLNWAQLPVRAYTGVRLAAWLCQRNLHRVAQRARGRSINHLLRPSSRSSPLCRCSLTRRSTFAAAAWPTRPTRWGRWATTSSPRSSASRAWATSWRRTPTRTTWSTSEVLSRCGICASSSLTTRATWSTCAAPAQATWTAELLGPLIGKND